ncbi:MAG TPA: DOMON-like domain-containing protein [Caulobacteraceae bacterium]|nr:DOMON-like domain-containing protein [Caulobacteraceae bacterium]
MTYVEAEATRTSGGVLLLRYRLAGSLADVMLPQAAPSIRKSVLWRHTCLEAFVRAEGAEGYFEFNLSPSTEWAAYAFDGYRQGMKPADVTPGIEVERISDTLELRATLELGATLPPDAPWHVGLSAVVETGEGLSYWALAHAPGRADFHHPDCFALELP